MAEAEGESLESWLNKASSPSNRQEDWEYIIGFCDQVNKELEGPLIAVRLLAHKIQSPQEWEALQALTVLEACMKNCGRRFHNEVGKFRFLNELIKVISPKYLGERVTESVKSKVIEMLYSWTIALPDETKITEAYQMLKKQGIVSSDPELSADKTLICSEPDRPHNPVFENEEKSKRLQELLKSKKPEDLQEANRLIKNMVKEDEVRAQREAQRSSTLEEVRNSVRLLSEMLQHFNKEQSSVADRELLKDLHDDCDKLRTAVFKLAAETEDDASLGEILQASDDLSRVINSYKSRVEEQDGGAERSASTLSQRRSGEVLVDLAGLDLNAPASLQTNPPAAAPLAQSLPGDLFTFSPALHHPPPPHQPITDTNNQRTPSVQTPRAQSLLDEELLSLGLCDPVSSSSSSTQLHRDRDVDKQPSAQVVNPMLDFLGSSAQVDFLRPAAHSPATTSAPKPLSAAAAAGPVVLPSSCSATDAFSSLQDLAMLDLGTSSSGPAVLSSGVESHASACPRSDSAPAPPDSPLLLPLSPSLVAGSGTGLTPQSELSLNNVFVPLDSITPSRESPVTAYYKDGLCVLLHFASDCPAGRPDVLVVVVSMLNTAPLPVRNLTLQAAVPKTMRVKLQPPSSTELAPFNPILPPSAITQIMLLANPLKEKVRMRYKLSFMLGDRQCTETGEVDQFPAVERWGKL